MRRKLYETATFVLECIQARGINPDPASRITQMCRMLSTPDGSPTAIIKPTNRKSFAIAREALRDVRQLGFIFDYLLQESLGDAGDRRIRNMLHDSVLPQDDLTLSRGRDTQCELFVAAICEKAGLHPIFDESPDIRCKVRAEAIGIAVKRIKSDRKVRKNIREAAKQIRRSGIPGVICADVSFAYNQENKPVMEPMTVQAYRRVHDEALRGKVDQFHRELNEELVRACGVCGLILHDHQIRLDPVDGWELDSMYMDISTSPHNQRRRRLFRAFCKQYEGGYPST